MSGAWEIEYSPTGARAEGSLEGRMSAPEEHGRVLVILDDPGMGARVHQGLGNRGFEVVLLPRVDEAIALVQRGDVDLVVTGSRTAEASGVDIRERLEAVCPGVPVVMIGAKRVGSVVWALRAGLHDYVFEPLDMKQLARSVRQGVNKARVTRTVHRLREDGLQVGPDAMVGESFPMREVWEVMSRVAATDASVLVTGESGTGKELVARQLHERSHRARGPFVAINCAAVPASLLESELFGHVRGAFTDAHSSRAGLFAEAHGGTLFLDEVGEMPLEVQPKLLRALQEREVRPVGGSGNVAFDARIVASTNRDLMRDVRESRFRQDLYYRLNVVRVKVPPLRRRGHDILLLAQHFVLRFAKATGKGVRGISPAAATRLLSYDWPGNVRELENCIERAVTLTLFDQIVPDDLPETVIAQGEDGGDRKVGPEELVSLAELERAHIHRVLASLKGNKSRAAEVLGLDRRTLYRKLKRYEKG